LKTRLVYLTAASVFTFMTVSTRAIKRELIQTASTQREWT